MEERRYVRYNLRGAVNFTESQLEQVNELVLLGDSFCTPYWVNLAIKYVARRSGDGGSAMTAVDDALLKHVILFLTEVAQQTRSAFIDTAEARLKVALTALVLTEKEPRWKTEGHEVPAHSRLDEVLALSKSLLESMET